MKIKSIVYADDIVLLAEGDGKLVDAFSKYTKLKRLENKFQEIKDNKNGPQQR